MTSVHPDPPASSPMDGSFESHPPAYGGSVDGAMHNSLDTAQSSHMGGHIPMNDMMGAGISQIPPGLQEKGACYPPPPPTYEASMSSAYTPHPPTYPPPMMAGMGEPVVDWASRSGDDLRILNEVESCDLEMQLDLMHGISSRKKFPNFRVKTLNGNQLFFLQEAFNNLNTETERAFVVQAKDSRGNVVFSIQRPYSPWAYCCICCACIMPCKSTAEIYIGGRKVAYLIQKWTCSIYGTSAFDMYDGRDKKIFQIDGTMSCFCTTENTYKVKPTTGGKEGLIRRTIGLNLGAAENREYRIFFPENATVEEKAMLICINILMDYRFGEYIK